MANEWNRIRQSRIVPTEILPVTATDIYPLAKALPEIGVHWDLIIEASKSRKTTQHFNKAIWVFLAQTINQFEQNHGTRKALVG